MVLIAVFVIFANWCNEVYKIYDLFFFKKHDIKF